MEFVWGGKGSWCYHDSIVMSYLVDSRAGENSMCRINKNFMLGYRGAFKEADEVSLVFREAPLL